MYTCINMYLYIYVYKYISEYVYIYIFISKYVYIYMYMYIYILSYDVKTMLKPMVKIDVENPHPAGVFEQSIQLVHHSEPSCF